MPLYSKPSRRVSSAYSGELARPARASSFSCSFRRLVFVTYPTYSSRRVSSWRSERPFRPFRSKSFTLYSRIASSFIPYPLSVNGLMAHIDVGPPSPGPVSLYWTQYIWPHGCQEPTYRQRHISRGEIAV